MPLEVGVGDISLSRSQKTVVAGELLGEPKANRDPIAAASGLGLGWVLVTFMLGTWTEEHGSEIPRERRFRGGGAGEGAG
jgi:hypothetical protein